MNAGELRASSAANTPPTGLSGPLRALWHAAKGEWEAAHALVQDDDGKDAAWVHAYLHRVEDDQANAAYWYGRAGKPRPLASLDAEWSEIAGELLSARA